MLTDQEIEDIGEEHAPYVDHKFARAIESAATAPLLARIAELETALSVKTTAVGYWKDRCAAVEREFEEARKDAERYRCLVRLFGVTKLPCLLEPVVGDYVADGKESLDAAIDAVRAAIKEQT